MFSKIKTNTSTTNFLTQINKLKQIIQEADAIIIGAGSGLSTAAGFTYSGQRFNQYFSDFQQKYHIQDMYSGGFYPYETLEEYWAWWSRHIYYNRYIDIPKDTYQNLFQLVKNKDYFVITTNVDHCFQKAGFDKKRLFYTQGDYGLFQCSHPCHQETYDNQELIEQMMQEQNDMKIPSSLIPYCPKCGRPMTMNLRCDNTFVQDEGWYQAQSRYEDFIRRHEHLKIVYLELGVGYNTPVIIKYPFWRYTSQNKNATYVCINANETMVPNEIKKQSLCVKGNIDEILQKINKI